LSESDKETGSTNVFSSVLYNWEMSSFGFFIIAPAQYKSVDKSDS